MNLRAIKALVWMPLILVGVACSTDQQGPQVSSENPTSVRVAPTLTEASIPSFSIRQLDLSSEAAAYALQLGAATVDSSQILYKYRLELGNQMVHDWVNVQDTSMIELHGLRPDSAYSLSIIPTIGDEVFSNRLVSHNFTTAAVEVAEEIAAASIQGPYGPAIGFSGAQLDPRLYGNDISPQSIYSAYSDKNRTHLATTDFFIGQDYRISIPSDWHLVQSRIFNAGNLHGQYTEEFVTALQVNPELGDPLAYQEVVCLGTTGIRGNGAEYKKYRQDSSGRIYEYCVKTRSSNVNTRGGNNVQADAFYADEHIAMGTSGYNTVNVRGLGQVSGKRRLLVNYFKNGFDIDTTKSHLEARCDKGSIQPLGNHNRIILPGLQVHRKLLSVFPEVVTAKICKLLPRSDFQRIGASILISYIAKKPGSNEVIEVNWEYSPESFNDGMLINFLPLFQADMLNTITELPRAPF